MAIKQIIIVTMTIFKIRVIPTVLSSGMNLLQRMYSTLQLKSMCGQHIPVCPRQ
ncbi:hypothetical protein JCM10914_2990 [Paenibacillus sp. JCM 10914]|nr:hypothetical protein JCM10914_2990 [Paenibacillus sp. JCM 10914]